MIYVSSISLSEITPLWAYYLFFRPDRSIITRLDSNFVECSREKVYSETPYQGELSYAINEGPAAEEVALEFN